MRQIRSPTPLTPIERVTDRSAYEESTEDEEDDHRLMTRSGEDIGNGEKPAVSAEGVKLDKEKIAPVIHQDQYRGQSS
jgi:hypothetical protein